MANYPIRNENHLISKKAILILENTLPIEWIVRKEDGDDDYGIDADIEIAFPKKESNDFFVSGYIIKAQIKGHREIVFDEKGFYSQNIKISTANYWFNMNVPVVLFIVDTSNNNVYWLDAKKAYRSNYPFKGSKNTSYKISEKNLLTSENVIPFLAQLIGEPNKKQAIEKILDYESEINNMIYQFCVRDCQEPVEEENLEKIKKLAYLVFSIYHNVLLQEIDKYENSILKNLSKSELLNHEACKTLKFLIELLNIFIDDSKKDFIEDEKKYWELNYEDFFSRFEQLNSNKFLEDIEERGY
ncbi:DUF4365 domain-containing protein [Aliarcobacter butzleri]|uniref:DUF4365 domain-containing protein n=1 Tax=Aliarcobacter butzleri TaxID=28197 RepID=UPI001260EC98|nr:DUF4365 domain-containing protein [Aliarcobacter butzleri]